MLAVHWYSTYEDTIVALRMVKDELLRVGGAINFPITRELLIDVGDSFSKYNADCLARQEADAKAKPRRKQEEEENSKRVQVDNELALIDNQIRDCKASISAANDLIEDAKENLKQALDGGKNVRKDLAQTALAEITVGTDNKRKFDEDLQKLEKKKKKLKK